MEEARKKIARDIWAPPANWKVQGAWFWWFWLFFIHDEGTKRTGKCRQLMVIWSIKKDGHIACNSLEIRTKEQIEKIGEMQWKLNGAAAAWYFDGKEMHEDFVLETSQMGLDGKKLELVAPGKNKSSFVLEGDEYVTKIKSKTHEFELRARQTDMHRAIGPVHGRSPLPFGMEVEGTRIERLELSGEEVQDGKRTKLRGTAYFQKILVAAPAPQWYWGLYHFSDGSFFTYMVPYVGRAMLADNAWKGAKLKKPTLPMQQDIMLYYAPSKKVFEGNSVHVLPKSKGGRLWSHTVLGKGKGFEIEANADAYSHACWKFTKKVGVLPAKSSFHYNEYPAVLERLEVRMESGKRIVLQNGWGNMENSWGFLL